MIGFEIRNMFNTGMFSIGDPTNERMLHLPSWVGAKPGQFLVLMDAAEWHELSREDEPLPTTHAKKPWEIARDHVLSIYQDASDNHLNSGHWIKATGFIAKGFQETCHDAWLDAWEQIADIAMARVLKRFPSAGIRSDESGFWIEDHHGPIFVFLPDRTPHSFTDEQAAWVETDKATAYLPDAIVTTCALESPAFNATYKRDYFPSTVSITTVDPHGVTIERIQ